MTTDSDPDARLLAGQIEAVAPFALPLGHWDAPPDETTMPAFLLTESGQRLLRFTHRRAFDWVNDPDAPSWEPLLGRLAEGEAEAPVEGDLDALWRCLLATFRADRLNEGLIATHQVALTRIGNELRRRLSERIAAGLHPPHVVSTQPGSVEAASSVRLPFETRGWSRRFQEALRGALGTLEPKPGRVLSGVYASEAESGHAVDAENVLFYNVGTGAFARLSTEGLRFERSFEPPFPDERAFFPLRHYHRYLQVPRGAPFHHHEPERILARWDGVPLSDGAATKPAAVWWAMRRAQSTVQANTDGPFGLRVILHGAAGRPLSGVMKPLFDGVIAAFHGWSGPRDEALAIRLAAQLGATPDAVEKELFDARENALPARAVLKRHGDGVAWNPQDELCLAGELLAGEPDGPPRLSGELFTLRARPQAW